MTPTPQTDVKILRVPSCFDNIDHHVVMADFARQLERDIAELNERLIERQETLMAAIVDLKAATQLLTRCRNSAGRMGIDLYEDIQEFLHTQPSYRC